MVLVVLTAWTVSGFSFSKEMELGQARICSIVIGKGNASAFVSAEELKIPEYNSSSTSTQRKADGELRLEVERNGQFFVLKK